MILATLYLKIGVLKLPVEYTYGFLKRSRFLCNYLEREVLKKLRFKAVGFNRIVISLDAKPADGVFVNSSQVLCVELPFNPTEYESKSDEALTFYYMEYLKAGLHKCAESVSIPLEALLQGMKEFEAGGFKNEWLYKRRAFREYGLNASLLCALTMNEFKLRLQIQRGKETVFDQVILQTDPDEIAFAYRFNDIVVEDDSLVVVAKYDVPLWKKPISTFL